jgi:hypothetical protein
MQQGRITVGVVNWYSTPHIQNLLLSAKTKAADPELEFVICDNTGGADHELYDTLGNTYRIIPFNPAIPDVLRRKGRYGSYAHGAALNMLLDKVDTEYCLFADPDCIILADAWDHICRLGVTAPSMAFGAPYHSSKIPKYHNFPSPIFIFFNTEDFRRIGPDWTPYNVSWETDIQDQMRRILAITGSMLGRQVAGKGFFLSQMAGVMRRLLGNSGKDTGWRIAAQARHQRYQAKLLTTALVDKQLHPIYANQPSVQELMEQFELFLWQGLPFVTHYYSSTYRQPGKAKQAIERWRNLAQTVSSIHAGEKVSELLVKM